MSEVVFTAAARRRSRPFPRPWARVVDYLAAYTTSHQQTGGGMCLSEVDEFEPCGVMLGSTSTPHAPQWQAASGWSW
jgi:hypothetical protein